MSEHDWRNLGQQLVAAAVQAPSSHNTQPWLFRLGPGMVDLIADRTRALPANDPEDRELTISCGCALMNLRVAAAALGLAADVTLLPDGDDGDRLARLSWWPGEPSGVEASLAAGIPERRTYRQPFDEAAPDEAAIARLITAAEAEGVTLRTLADAEARATAARLVSEGDAEQWADRSWRRELAAWMHPRRRGDGLAMPALAVPVAQLVVRTFDMGGGVGAKDQALAEGSPLLAVLSSEGDDARAWLMAGMGLQRLLLTGVQFGLQASYLNQPVQVAALRPRLQHLTGGGFPQLLLRIGRPLATPPPSPRRPLADVVEWAE